jgi:hypothetical protein
MVTPKEAVQLWEDHVGDSGQAPTDEELHKFAQAVEEKARKPFVKLHKKWKRKSKEYESTADNNLGNFSVYRAYQDVSDIYHEFARKLKNRLDAKN